MAHVTESRPLDRVVMPAPTLSAQFWVRLLAGSLGTLLCAVGSAVAVFPFPGLPEGFQLAKFTLGVLIFTSGIVFARTGKRPPSSELHFDPKYGEFILVPVDAGWEAAQCVMSTDVAQVDVSGRHLSVASEDARLSINIAMQDAMSAKQVSETCQSPSKAA